MASAPTFRGAEKMIAKLREIDERVDQNVAKEMFSMGQVIMSTSKRLVPVKLGTLRASGNVQRPTRSGFAGRNVEVVLEYGGPAGSSSSSPDSFNHSKHVKDVGYAAPVHENHAAVHKVGQSNYLADPFFAARNEFPRFVGKNVLGGG